MATHSSVLAWRIPGMAEPRGLPSTGVAQSRTRPMQLSSSSSSNVDHLHIYTCSLLDSFPYRSLQSTEWSPLCYLYGRPLLASCHLQSSVYLSTPIVQFIPCPFASYFCFINKFFKDVSFSIPRVCPMRHHAVFVLLCLLISLSMIIPRPCYVATNGINRRINKLVYFSQSSLDFIFVFLLNLKSCWW